MRRINRIEEKFENLKREDKKAFVTFITAGDPDLSTTRKLVLEMEAHGADIVELGVPFSDPIADGPRIQASSIRSLRRGTTLPRIINLVREIRRSSNVPLVMMTYFNPVYIYGIERFVRNAKSAGADGVIVPDLPPEEAGKFIKKSREFNLSNIFLLAPTSTKDRIKKVIKEGSGFIYYVSLTGVTGERKSLPPDMRRNIQRIKSLTKKPVVAGFGISNTRQIKTILKEADGVVVGSALVGVIERYSGSRMLFKKFNKKISEFSRFIHSIPRKFYPAG